MRAADCRNVSGVCCCGIIRITDDLTRGWCGHLELLGRYCGVDANYLTQVTLLPVVVRGWSENSMGGINSTGHGLSLPVFTNQGASRLSLLQLHDVLKRDRDGARE